MFGVKENKDEPKVEDYSKEGFKISLSNLRKTIAKCELKDDKSECRKIFKELGVDLIEDI